MYKQKNESKWWFNMYKVSSFYFQPCICGECLVLCRNWTYVSASLSNDSLGVWRIIVGMNTMIFVLHS